MKQKNSAHTTIVACLLLFGLIALYVYKAKVKTHGLTLEQYLPPALSHCQNLEQEKYACYKETAQYLSAKFSLNEVFAYMEKNEKDPVIFAGCHSTLHFLGSEQYKNNKNLSNLLSNGTPVCFAGYYHGVLEGYFNEKKLDSEKAIADIEENIRNLCQKSVLPNAKKYNECLHGLGHALMFATGDELPQSLKLCDKLATESDQDWCYSGAFMENSTSSTNRDHPSQYLKQDDLLYPCSILEEKYLNMCYTLQGFYFAEKANYDFQKTADLCRQIPANYIEKCFDSMGQTAVGYTQDPAVMKDICTRIPEENFRAACVGGVAGTLIERYNDGQKRAAAFCNILDGQEQTVCQNRLKTYQEN